MILAVVFFGGNFDGCMVLVMIVVGMLDSGSF